MYVLSLPSTDLSSCLDNFIGPLVYRKEDPPRHVPSFIVVVVTSITARLLAVVYMLVCNGLISDGIRQASWRDTTKPTRMTGRIKRLR